MGLLNTISADLLQNVSIGLLTLIVPIGIYVLEEKNSNYSKLDRNIKVHLIDGGNFLIELGWIFLPLVFWNVVGEIVQLVIFIIWAVGIYLIMKRISRIYKSWITLSDSEKHVSRLEILRKGKFEDNKLISSWNSVWSATNLGASTEREYFKIFSDEIDKCFKNASSLKPNLASNLLRQFNLKLDNRDTVFLLIFEDFFLKVLNWHKDAWENEYNLLGEKNDINKWAGYSEICNQLDVTIRKIIERAINEKQSYAVFKYFKSHLDINADLSVNQNGNDYFYLNSFVMFNEVINSAPNSFESFDIWNHYFPEEWKITESNYKKSIVVRFWWNFYSDWASSKIGSSNDKEGKQLEQVSRGLLPGINPITWAIILTFAFRSWSGDRIKNLIEEQRIFGFSVSGSNEHYHNSEEQFWEDFRKEIEKKDYYTIELATLLLNGYFQEIDEYLKSLEALRFSEVYKENYRLKILAIFKKIKVCIDRRIAKEGVLD